ncbi:MAG: cysteine desulfurase [Fimbriimonadaceae bacterium]|nr:cysteine desulfurase [Fimbriimonadaceae bacterium]
MSALSELYERIVADFPILQRQVHGRPLVYLDSAASSLTPRPVVAALVDFYEQHRANVHRGLHQLSAEATDLFEGSRDRIARFLHAPRREQIVFTRGCTSAINLVAQAWARPRLGPGDVVVLSELEHHANLVSWQIVCRQTGAKLRYLPLTAEGHWDLTELARVIRDDVKVVAVAHISNVLGGLNPVEAVVAQAHRVGAVCLVDAAQSVGHLPVDVQALGADFVCFSSHKMCGPTGLGVLYGKLERLEAMEPLEGGGDMIVHVDWEESTWNQVPYKFEAGTPPIAEAIGLRAACDYLDELGLATIREHTQALTEAAVLALEELPGVKVMGPKQGRVGPVAFTVEGVHPHDVATILDGEGVAVRAGHHCAQPLHARLGIPATARASFYLTNRASDVDRLVAAVTTVQKVFGHVR